MLSDEMLEIVPPMSNVIGISGNMIRGWASRVARLERVAEVAEELCDFRDSVNWRYFGHECGSYIKKLKKSLKELKEE